MFRKKTHEKIKKIDLIITSMVLGAIVAGAFGIKKKREREQEQQQEPSLIKHTSLLRKIFDILLGK